MMLGSVLEAKIVILGQQGVGKTSILTSYISKNFNPHVSPTIGASFFTCSLKISNVDVRLQIWDTAGQERYRAMAPMYYRNANAALLVYDITCESSFEVMKTWVTELKKNVEDAIVLCILANKTDLDHERQVSTEIGEKYANSVGAAYFETSAIANGGIEDAFHLTTQEIVDHSKKHKDYTETEEDLTGPSISLHKTDQVQNEKDEGSYMFCC